MSNQAETNNDGFAEGEGTAVEDKGSTVDGIEYRVSSEWTVQDLLRMMKRGQISPPAEFQRGPKWSATQQKLYIDSIFRGYPSPAIYLHSREDILIRRDSAQKMSVIDGQQRLNAMERFGSGNLRLPKPDGRPGWKHMPPRKSRPERWEGLEYGDLPDDLKLKFANRTLVVILLKSKGMTAVRDLFIRLQAGTALSAQERRDAWPGELPEFMKDIAGHEHKGEGKTLFRERIAGKDDMRRKAAAQMFLAWHRQREGGALPTTDSSALDELYREMADAHAESEGWDAFTMLVEIMGRSLRKRKGKWPTHALLHILLVLDELISGGVLEITDIYEDGATAQKMDGFAQETLDEIEQANRAVDNNNATEEQRRLHNRVGRWVRQGSETSGAVRQRHHHWRERAWSRFAEGTMPPRAEPDGGWFDAADQREAWRERREEQRKDDPLGFLYG